MKVNSNDKYTPVYIRKKGITLSLRKLEEREQNLRNNVVQVNSSS